MDPNQAMPPSASVQRSTSQPMAAGAPRAMPQAAPQAASQPAPQAMPQANPQSTPQGMPQSGIPHRTNNANDLYAQITAEDEEIVVAPKKKTAPLISFMAIFMKVTFWLDEFKHSNERLFIFLHTIWAGVMGILYSAGLITLFLSIFSFMQLPVYLESFFSERGILYDSLEMSDYSFSKINVINLRDKNNTFHIPSITVHSTFADFLQDRIRMVEASNLQINVKANANDQKADLDLIINLLRALSEPQKTGLKLDVNVISINNAVLNIQLQDRTIPVSFSLSGSYIHENQLIIPFSINENFLKIDATLEITGPENARQVTIKATSPGALTLPQRPTEEIQKDSKISIQMEDHQVQQIQLEAKLNYAYALKTIRTSLQNNGQNAFNGSLLFTAGESSDGVHTSNLSTDVTFNFQGLTLDQNAKLTTNQPLSVNLRRLVHKSTVIEGLDTTLNGDLVCSIDQASCSYTLKESTLLRMQNFKFDVKGKSVQFSQNPSFTILPAQKESLRLQLNSPYFKMEAPMENIKLTGTIGEKLDKLSVEAKSANLQMTLAQKPSDTVFRILIQSADYKTSDLTILHVNLLMDNYFDPTAKMTFSAFSVRPNSDLLLKPFSLELVNIGEQTSIKAHVLTSPIHLNAQGFFDPFKSTFSGRFSIPLIDLENIPFNLSELSPLFPKNISDLKGQFSASGQLKVNGISSIAGPFYLGLKDVGFSWDNTLISGINGVIGLQSLEPLVTGNNQKLFIQNIQSFIPISNLLFQFYINNQSLRLSNVSGQIADQDVIMSSALISLKNPSATLPLRTADNFDLSRLNFYFNLPGITLKGGNGSLNLPVNVTENGINLGDLTLKMIDSTWQKAEGTTDILGLFKPTDTGYTVRSGQLILTPLKQLQVAVDGWRLPSKVKNSFGPVTLNLTEPLLKQGVLKEAPSEIQKLQEKFGMEE